MVEGMKSLPVEPYTGKGRLRSSNQEEEDHGREVAGVVEVTS